MKEVLLAGAAAAVGGLIVAKWGAAIEAKAVAMHVPPTVAHMGVVGGSAAVVFYVARQALG